MREFSISIQNWYRRNRRNLPWRESNNPYKIWLSEIILQQTRVDQGISYYLKFIKCYSTVKKLAEADEDEVLNLWQGLGYYSRARNMHATAKSIVNDFDGEFPDQYKDILGLKGVGEYTAAAVGSIAFGLPYPVVDGNVFRVLTRFLCISDPIDTSKGKKLVREAAFELLDKKNPGDHNQALMELGSLICTPKKPDCHSCPVSEKCMAFAAHKQTDFPVKSKKTKVRKRFFHYLVITDKESLLIRKRPAGDIWQGLYDFPLIEPNGKEDDPTSDKRFKAALKYTEDGQFIHLLSHQKIMAHFWIIEVNELRAEENELKIKKTQLEDYPLPQLLIRYLQNSQFFSGE